MRTTRQSHKAKAKEQEKRSSRRAAKKDAPKFPGLDRKVIDLCGRLQDAMQEAVDNEVPAEDAPVYLAGKRDVYAASVLIVLEDLGIKVPVPELP